ncbi:MAG: prepilin-type N-terminal cleavage/methylation domain-containing protein [Candidatus Nealsonbacteria bacterium]|nr:prepilin-type N-terminal cleavage/methylation domain-containing protein [Candidatus Nealsonbacteria bacterium]
MKLKEKNSFTLIELLVVISIIAILSSAVLVYMKPTKENAKLAGELEFRSSVSGALGAYVTGAWMFEGATIGEAGYDSSGYKNNCIPSSGGNFVYASSAHRALGNALSMSGNKWFNCGDSSSRPNLFPTDITMEAWAKAETLDNNYRGIVTNKYGNNYGINLYMHRNNIGSRIGTIQGSSRNNTLVTTTKAPSIGTWYHIVVTYNSKNRKAVLYVNGKIEKELTLPGTRILAYSITNNFFGIGCNYKTNNTTNCNDRFIGTIDDVKVYDQSLLTFEIKQHYAEGLKKLELAGLK